jgi:hypothetical protein
MSTYNADRRVQITEQGKPSSNLKFHERGDDGRPICLVGQRWTHEELLSTYSPRRPQHSGLNVPCVYTKLGPGLVDCGLCAQQGQAQSPAPTRVNKPTSDWQRMMQRRSA